MTREERLATLRRRIDEALETLDELNEVLSDVAKQFDALDPQP